MADTEYTVYIVTAAYSDRDTFVEGGFTTQEAAIAHIKDLIEEDKKDFGPVHVGWCGAMAIVKRGTSGYNDVIYRVDPCKVRNWPGVSNKR